MAGKGLEGTRRDWKELENIIRDWKGLERTRQGMKMTIEETEWYLTGLERDWK